MGPKHEMQWDGDEDEEKTFIYTWLHISVFGVRSAACVMWCGGGAVR